MMSSRTKYVKACWIFNFPKQQNLTPSVPSTSPSSSGDRFREARQPLSRCGGHLSTPPVRPPPQSTPPRPEVRRSRQPACPWPAASIAVFVADDAPSAPTREPRAAQCSENAPNSGPFDPLTFWISGNERDSENDIYGRGDLGGRTNQAVATKHMSLCSRGPRHSHISYRSPAVVLGGGSWRLSCWSGLAHPHPAAVATSSAITATTSGLRGGADP